jgi:selenocysteine-specific elongation factor
MCRGYRASSSSKAARRSTVSWASSRNARLRRCSKSISAPPDPGESGLPLSSGDLEPAGELDAALIEATLERLDASERENPWACGATSLALARALAVPEARLVRILAHLSDAGRIARRAGYYCSPGFVPELEAEQRAVFDHIFAADSERPLAPVALADAVALVKASPAPGLSQAFDTLFASGALIKVAEQVYRADQLATIRAKLEAALRRRGRVTPAEFRDEIGTSRKFAVPLLEWFDAAGVTIRSGDVRLLRETV